MPRAAFRRVARGGCVAGAELYTVSSRIPSHTRLHPCAWILLALLEPLPARTSSSAEQPQVENSTWAPGQSARLAPLSPPATGSLMLRHRRPPPHTWATAFVQYKRHANRMSALRCLTLPVTAARARQPATLCDAALCALTAPSTRWQPPVPTACGTLESLVPSSSGLCPSRRVPARRPSPLPQPCVQRYKRDIIGSACSLGSLQPAMCSVATGRSHTINIPL